jgi:hypothetical protein
MDEESLVYVHSGILHNLYKKKILSFVTIWTNLEDIILSGTGQAQKDKHCRIFTCMWNLKKKLNSQNYRVEWTFPVAGGGYCW